MDLLIAVAVILAATVAAGELVRIAITRMLTVTPPSPPRTGSPHSVAGYGAGGQSRASVTDYRASGQLQTATRATTGH